MSSIKNKVVFITGASSGMGKACAEQFAASGSHLILTARRLDKIETLANELKNKHKINAIAVQLDIQDKNQVSDVIQKLPDNLKDIDILLNNAGTALSSSKIQDGNLDDWDVMINTNFRGLLYVTRTILPGMIARNRGHIINIGSTAAHEYYAAGNVYCATKHAVKAISKSLRIDLLGTAIRVTEIDPGLTQTEFSDVRWNDKERAKEFYSGYTPLVANDIAETVIFCATRPLHVDIAELVIYPTDQASATYLNKNKKTTDNLFD